MREGERREDQGIDARTRRTPLQTAPPSTQSDATTQSVGVLAQPSKSYPTVFISSIAPAVVTTPSATSLPDHLMQSFYWLDCWTRSWLFTDYHNSALLSRITSPAPHGFSLMYSTDSCRWLFAIRSLPLITASAHLMLLRLSFIFHPSVLHRPILLFLISSEPSTLRCPTVNHEGDDPVLPVSLVPFLYLLTGPEFTASEPCSASQDNRFQYPHDGCTQRTMRLKQFCPVLVGAVAVAILIAGGPLVAAINGLVAILRGIDGIEGFIIFEVH